VRTTLKQKCSVLAHASPFFVGKDSITVWALLGAPDVWKKRWTAAVRSCFFDFAGHHCRGFMLGSSLPLYHGSNSSSTAASTTGSLNVGGLWHSDVLRPVCSQATGHAPCTGSPRQSSDRYQCLPKTDLGTSWNCRSNCWASAATASAPLRVCRTGPNRLARSWVLSYCRESRTQSVSLMASSSFKLSSSRLMTRRQSSRLLLGSSRFSSTQSLEDASTFTAVL